MKVYKIIVEGSFLALSGSSKPNVGMYCTFLTRATSASNAVESIKNSLIDRLRNENIEWMNEGFFRTYFVVDQIWEVSEGSNSKERASYGGASFFKIGVFNKLYAALKRVILEKSKPWLLIDISKRSIIPGIHSAEKE